MYIIQYCEGDKMTSISKTETRKGKPFLLYHILFVCKA